VSTISAAAALYSIHERYISARRFIHASRMLRDPLPYIDFRRQDGYCRMLRIHLETQFLSLSFSPPRRRPSHYLYCSRTNGFDYTVRQLMLLFYLSSFYRYMWVHTNPAAQSIITQFHFDRQNSNFKAPAAAHIVLSNFNRYTGYSLEALRVLWRVLLHWAGLKVITFARVSCQFVFVFLCGLW
jgi:hypothetical protein